MSPPQAAALPAVFPTYLVPSLPFRRRKSSTSTISSFLSTSSSSPSISPIESPSPISEGPTAPGYLNTHTSHLRCARCAADLALSTQIISKGFTGRHGRAYLVSATEPSSTSTVPTSKASSLPNLPNTHVHRPVPRTLVTGAHTVGDISCAHCGSVLGWKYVAAEEETQKYKVGKFILETKRVCRCSTWEGEGQHAGGEGAAGGFFALEDVDVGLQEEELGGVPSAGGKKGLNASRGMSSMGPPPNVLTKARAEIEEVEFDSQDEDECEDLFLGVWTPGLAARRRRHKRFGRVQED